VLDDRGTGLGFQQVQEIFPFSRHFQTGFAHPASYTVCIRGFLPEVKRPLRESDHSPSYRVQVKMCGAIPPLHNMLLWFGAEFSTGATWPWERVYISDISMCLPFMDPQIIIQIL